MHNLYSLYEDYQKQGEKVWANFNASRRDVIWYYQTVIKAICLNASGEIFDDLKQLGERIDELNGEDN